MRTSTIFLISALLLGVPTLLGAQEKSPEVPLTPPTPSTETTAPAVPEVLEPVVTPSPPTPPVPPAPEMTPAEKEAAEYRKITGTIRMPEGNREYASLAQVTPEAAEATALGRHPGAEVDDVEFEVVNGYLFYEVELEIDDRKLELLIDAGSGKVVRTEVEDDD